MAHAKLSPSSAYRWFECPGAPAFEAQFPDNDSPASREGSYLHEVAAHALHRGGVIEHPPQLDESYAEEWPLTDERKNVVSRYVGYVEGIRASTPSLVERVERRVTLGGKAEGIWGTADYIAIAGGTMYVVDLKCGIGHVSAEGNPQLAIYALSALDSVPEAQAVTQLVLVIVQPRTQTDGPLEWIITRDELESQYRGLVEERAEAANTPGAPLRAGKHCGFCKGRQRCPALREQVMLAATEMFPRGDLIEIVPPPAPVTMQTDDLVRLVQAKKMISDWVEHAEAELLERVAKGQAPNAPFKVVERVSNRRWVDEAKAAEALEFYGADPYERKLVSPAEAERRLLSSPKLGGSKKAVKIAVDGQTCRQPIGVALVPLTDKRPAITSMPPNFPALSDTDL